MAIVIDGKAIAAQTQLELRAEVNQMLADGMPQPCLAVILVGHDPASEIYVASKIRACHFVGVQSIEKRLSQDCTEAELISLVEELNADDAVNGILLQLPLPAHISVDEVLERIDPRKDVDGFHPHNIGRLLQRRPLMRPCTPWGVMKLLESTKVSLMGKHAVVVGCSNIVGRPMALELLLVGATVTVCHRYTENLEMHVSRADILVSAVGKPALIRGEWIKPGSVVIDIGITRLPSGAIVGDVEFEAAKQKAGWITPVPGGVGPMTVAILMQNTVLAAKRRYNDKNL
jgi:methylenetetrahydrofolate dehydrogenase (NADP+)/methenyltetrahydrofolate cyclohydrolase